jgi:hypothetical protein
VAAPIEDSTDSWYALLSCFSFHSCSSMSFWTSFTL